MVRRQHAQRNIFEMILPDGEKLWDPALRRIDEVLEDEALIDQVEEALRRRRPQSGVRGRPGTPVAVVLRMLVLKHLYQWSFEECEREVRGSLVYRAFCHIGCEAVPDDTTLIRVAQALGPEVLKAMLERLVEVARRRKWCAGGSCGWTPRGWRRIFIILPTARCSRTECASSRAPSTKSAAWWVSCASATAPAA